MYEYTVLLVHVTAAAVVFFLKMRSYIMAADSTVVCEKSSADNYCRIHASHFDVTEH